MRRSIVIFTDLDGSLLDHEGYSCESALRALALVRARSIPLVFATSKTRSEVVRLQEDMGHPGALHRRKRRRDFLSRWLRKLPHLRWDRARPAHPYSAWQALRRDPPFRRGTKSPLRHSRRGGPESRGTRGPDGPHPGAGTPCETEGIHGALPAGRRRAARCPAGRKPWRRG